MEEMPERRRRHWRHGAWDVFVLWDWESDGDPGVIVEVDADGTPALPD